MKYIATIEGREFEIEINSDTEVVVNGDRLTLDLQAIAEQSGYSLLLEGHSYEAYLYPTEEGTQVLMRGHLYLVRVEDERQRRLRESAGPPPLEAGEFHLKSPMPGLVVGVPVEEGQTVNAGQNLIILESMKMQNELKSPRQGVVTRVRVRAGDRVEQNQPMLTLG
jgi:biotin carboxyl carrier protein